MKIKGGLDPEGLRNVQQLQFRTEGHSLEMKKRKRYISKAKESELRNRGPGRERDPVWGGVYSSVLGQL